MGVLVAGVEVGLQNGGSVHAEEGMVLLVSVT